MNTEDSSRVVNGEKVVSPELYVGSSFDDFMKNMHKDWHWWDYLQSWWYRFFWNWFSSIPSEIKYFIQRGMRGYSDRDSWSLDRHLTDIILCNLVELKANGHCFPSTLGPDGKWDYDEIRWAKILDDMIQGFALVKKCIIGDELMYHMGISEEDKIKMNEIYQTRKYTQPRCTTLEEEAEIKKAFDLFRDYFWCLND